MAAAAPSKKVSALVPPLGSDAVWAAGWTPAEARLAVDQYKRGTFSWGWQLSIDATGYPPIKAALDQRRAAPEGLPWEVVAAPAPAAAEVELEIARALYREHLARLLTSSLRDLAMCGLFVWYHPLVVDHDTLRTMVAPYQPPDQSMPSAPVGGVQRWPISAVGYTAYPMRGVCGYYAITQGGQLIQLPRPGTTEGDWTVGGDGDLPHLDAAICALDMEFTAGMLARRARSNLGVSAGKASPVGNMPPGVPVHTTDDAGNPVQGPGEAAAATLAGLGTEQTAALFPDGFQLGKFELTTTGAAEYFATDLRDSLLMVSLAVMGHGGALGKQDAQYQSQEGREVDVPAALNRRDVRDVERAANGLFAMLARLNSGLPAELAPKLDGHLPDADQADRIAAQQAQEQAEAAKWLKFHEVVAAERANGFDFVGLEGQARLDEIALRCGVTAPRLPTSTKAAKAAALDLAPTDLAKVVRVDEARASRGLPPIGDERGQLTITELESLGKAPAGEQLEGDVQEVRGDEPAPTPPVPADAA